MFKKLFWNFAYFCYPRIRDFLLFTRIMKHSGRQKYHLGHLNPKSGVEDVKTILKKNGFEPDVCAWIDDGEILSMRKRVGKKYQYHVRLFSDGEFKGHYEYSPESKPLAHLKAHVFKPANGYFHKLLKKVLK